MSTALYRRYRPETFADVIGQEHVTTPLITALEKNRVNHAYLFSGPRGCGKTTSARILARCLNCAEGPTPTPCGVCDSCRELSRDGGGSLDVIEMDAASHGGVDHARDLRERASFAPVRDRYKIFIIDEAHMVTREGFNALLKIVEEPPAHIKFIFATTEPNKVLGTIRSRTHHYPFRLVPPETLTAYLAKLAEEEGVVVADGVLPLVVRAGGGSVRDSLSILDQLIAGAADEGVTYNLAVALLGFTHGELLDTVIDAFAAGSAADVFASVDRVIQTGQDPRRFIEDLLERLRDLIIVKAVPEAAEQVLHGAATDQIERLKTQSQAFGGGELSRAADLTNTALNEMSGATNPQLHLELLCARIMLPSADAGAGSFDARLDRVERSLASGGSLPANAPTVVTSDTSVAPVATAGAGRAAVQAALNASRQKTNQGAGMPQPPMATEQGQNTQYPVRSQEQPPAPTNNQSQGSSPLAALQQHKIGAPLSERATQGESGGLGRPPLERQPVPPAAAQPAQAQAQSRFSAQGAALTSQAAQGVPPSTQGENVVNMVDAAWRDLVGRVSSPTARQFFAQCVPSKFANNQLFIRATMPVLRQVKDHIGELEQALVQVLNLHVKVRGEVDKTGAPATQNLQEPAQAHQQMGAGRLDGNHRPPLSAPGADKQQMPDQQSQQQRISQQQSPQSPNTPAPIAEGPRGGEQAWKAHGQPRTEAQPQWSPDDWNNPVTSWDVVSVPGSNAPEDSGSHSETRIEQSQQPQPTVKHSVETQQSHTESAEVPEYTPQPTVAAPTVPEQSAETAQQTAEELGEAADDTEQDAHPAASAPVEVEGRPVADGTTATDKPAQPGGEDPRGATGTSGQAEEAPRDLAQQSVGEPTPKVDSSQDSAAGTPDYSQQPVPAHTIAEEYGDYEGGYFGDSPVDEPEYVAGVGYISPQTPAQQQPDQQAGAHGHGSSGAGPLAGKGPLSGSGPLGSAPKPPASASQAAQASSPTRTPATPSAPSTPGKKLSFRERHAAQFEAGKRAVTQANAPVSEIEEPTEFVPSDEDTALEETVLMGQKAIEQILGGKVIEEHSNF